MNKTYKTLWPFETRTAIVAAVSLLFGLILTLVILRVALDWPGQESERIVFLGIFLLSLVPILLTLVDTMIERGGVVEAVGVKLDFSQAQTRAIPGTTIPANIGVAGQPVGDSSSHAILDSLRKAVASNVVVVDLEEGRAWWETRLLVLLAGAVRHTQPEIVVFLGTDGGHQKSFQGWATAKELLPFLLSADSQYEPIYRASLAAAGQWALAEPTIVEDGPPPTPPWTQAGLAQRYGWMAFEADLPNPFLAEQILASELSNKIESRTPDPGNTTEPHKSAREITLTRLEELFRPVLRREVIDESWTTERQLDQFFEDDTPYIAITHQGQFKSLVSRTSLVNSMLGSLVRKT